MTELADAELVRCCQAGDKAAFSTLVMRHQVRVRRLLLAALQNTADADDVLQEAFLRAYLNIESLRQPARFRAWVCGIALNLARMWQRSLVRRPILDVEPALWSAVADPRPLPEQTVEAREISGRLVAALADLPPAERDVLLLVYRDGLSHQETATQLGVSSGAVKVRVHRGRRRLRAALAPIDPYTTRRKETLMIPVIIHDVLANVSPLDHRPLLEPYFTALPTEKREQLWSKLAVLMTTREPFALGMFHQGDLVEDLSPEQREELQATVASLVPHRVVLLKEQEGERASPIWVGPSEGDSIVIRLRNQAMPRPLVIDLTTTLLGLNGTKVTQATVGRLHETIFYATLTVETGQETAEVDCRPSDALGLAVRLNVPIYIAPEVMAEAGVVPGEDGRYPIGDDHEPKVEWYSLLH